MSDTDRLRELLEAAAPDTAVVAAPERTAAVARAGAAARRRDRSLIAAVVAVVAILAVAVPMAHGGQREPEPADQPPGMAPCPDSPLDMGTTDETGIPDDLHVTVVRLCPGEANLGQRPEGVLTGSDAAAFLEDLRAAQPIDPGLLCADVGYVPYVLQLQSMSGDTTRVLLSESCGESVVVGDRRVRMSDAFAILQGNLERRRSGVPDLTCPTASRLIEDSDTWNTSFDPATATRGIVCDRTHRLVEGTLDDDELALVRSDLSTPPTFLDDAIGFDCEGPIQRRTILLANEAGDRAGWRFAVCNDPTGVESAAGGWHLGNAALSAVHDALLRAGPT